MARRSVRFGPANALADLEQRTLSQIPTLYGRLVYLASLRNPNSGLYRHHGLELLYGRQETEAALRSAHENGFRDWLDMPMPEQFEDLSGYLGSLEERRQQVLENWKRTMIYRGLIPDALQGPEKTQFLADLEAVMEILKAEAGVDAGGRAS
jgi:hypothetical protein